jgi:hypothetical protein
MFCDGRRLKTFTIPDLSRTSPAANLGLTGSIVKPMRHNYRGSADRSAASIIIERLRRALLRPTASLQHRAESVLHPPIAVEVAVSASRARREEQRGRRR